MTNVLQFIPLDSVESVLEVTTMMIYPQLEDGNPDMDTGTSYDEVSAEWLDSCPDHVKAFFRSVPSEVEGRTEIVNELIDNFSKISDKTFGSLN